MMSKERLTRRAFLKISVVGAVGAALAACQQNAPAAPTKGPAAVEPTKPAAAVAPTKPAEVKAGGYKEAPALAALVKAGKLPAVEQRIPAEPRVIKPIEKVGKYGGDWRMGTTGPADGAIFTRNTFYEGMVRWNVEWTEVIPGVVKSWEVGDGGKSFTWHLRKGMKWSDGQPFTAEDMAFWFEKMAQQRAKPQLFQDPQHWQRPHGVHQD